VQPFRDWLWNRDREAAAAERLTTLVARSGAGMSRDDLANALRLPPRILDDLLRALGNGYGGTSRHDVGAQNPTTRELSPRNPGGRFHQDRGS
jgi:hypothetical protein